MADVPNDHKDPYWTTLASNTEAKLGLPDGLLATIITRGERSNNDQVSEAGARTPFQIIPPTRKLAIDKYGIDPYLNPENAAEVAGRLLKDSMDRNKGDTAAAIGEYHGGTDRANWGPRTKSYVARVMVGMRAAQVAKQADTAGQSTFDRVMGQQQATQALQTPQIAAIYNAYQSGQMTPQEKADFEADVTSGTLMLPRGASLNNAQNPGAPAPQAAAPGAVPNAASNALPAAVLDAYANGQMTPEEKAQLEGDLKSGFVSLPPGAVLGGSSAIAQIPLPDGAKPGITPQADPSLVDKIIGTGEAGLNVLTGATTGMAGLAGGAVKGLAGSIIDGTIGTQQGVKQVENSAAAGADALTYAPRTQSGQDQAQAVGTAVQNLIPVAPLTAEMAALSRGVKPAVQAAVDKTAAVVDRGAPPVTSAAPAPAPVATPAAPAVAAFTVPDFVTNPAKSSMDKANRMLSDLLADQNIPAEVKAELQGASVNGLMKPENKAYVAAVAAARKEGNLDPARIDSIYQTMVEPAAAAPDAVATNAPAAAPDQATAAPIAAPAATPLPPDQLAATTRTAAIGGFGSKKATATLAAQAAPDAATVAAADRLGVLDHLQPDHYTTNQAYRQIAQLVKSQTGSPAAMAQREGLLKVAESADNLITQIGGTSDLSSLSTNAAAKMSATNLQLKAQATKLYNEVDSAIGLGAPAPAPNIIALIKDNAKKLGGEENLPGVERDLLKRLSPKADGAQPTYALLDKLRKDIGEAKRGKQNQFGSSNEYELARLEGALRADQKAIADAAGVGQQWELAQATSKAYKGVQDDLKAIYGKELDKSMAPLLTGAIKDLGTGNTSRFIKLLKSTPDDMRQEVTASGLASFFQRTSRGGEMDFAGYARWYDGLQRNKQAYAALMSNLPPAARQQLGDLALVARGVAMSKGEFIATGKAINPKALEAADSLMGRVFDEVRRRGVTGLVAEAVGSASGAPGLASALQSATTRNKPTVMAMADKLITSPEFIAAVKAADTKAAPAAARSLAYSKAFTKFIRALGAPRELRDREKWISQAMQAEATQSQNNQQRK